MRFFNTSCKLFQCIVAVLVLFALFAPKAAHAQLSIAFADYETIVMITDPFGDVISAGMDESFTEMTESAAQFWAQQLADGAGEGCICTVTEIENFYAYVDYADGLVCVDSEGIYTVEATGETGVINNGGGGGGGGGSGGGNPWLP